MPKDLESEDKMTKEQIEIKIEVLKNLIIKLTKENIQTNGRLNDVQMVHLVDYQDMYLYLKNMLELQQDIEKANKVIEVIEKEIWKIREKTFHKKDKDGQICNEWVDCLSFNDDVKPLINKIKELKGDKNEIY